MTVDVMLRDADRHADERGRLSAEDDWVDRRTQEIWEDDDDLDFAIDLHADCDLYDLQREVAIEGARAGATEAARKLSILMRACAEREARAELKRAKERR